MKMYVVGSSRHLEQDNQVVTFRDACQKLGAELARRGHEIFISSSSDNTVDPHVIQGANSMKKKTRVTVFRPDPETIKRDPDPDASRYFQGKEFPEIQFSRRECQGGWRVVHLTGLQECDVLLAIGGSERGTGHLIYSAEVLEKPVAVFRAFGGASESAWRDFDKYYVDQERMALTLDYDGSAKWAENLVRTTEEIRGRNPFRQIKPVETGVKLILALVSFLGWFALFWNVPSLFEPWFVVFLMLSLSAIAGSLTRSVLRSLGALEPEWKVANIFLESLLGIMLAFAIFIIPQSASVLLNNEPAKLDTINDIRRVGGALSVLSFFSALFMETAWARLSRLGREFISRGVS